VSREKKKKKKIEKKKIVFADDAATSTDDTVKGDTKRENSNHQPTHKSTRKITCGLTVAMVFLGAAGSQIAEPAAEIVFSCACGEEPPTFSSVYMWGIHDSLRF
jgi:hypothetical protein